MAQNYHHQYVDANGNTYRYYTWTGTGNVILGGDHLMQDLPAKLEDFTIENVQHHWAYGTSHDVDRIIEWWNGLPKHIEVIIDGRLADFEHDQNFGYVNKVNKFGQTLASYYYTDMRRYKARVGDPVWAKVLGVPQATEDEIAALEEAQQPPPTNEPMAAAAGQATEESDEDIPF